ncbi:hypothetical protein METBIDRAFT_10135 [Metschnikowia bicuspidata var. bicuspidata NRRL YB-4993]|uniref:DUF3835 domain-containing protein n=1 Tax=Metschnikowia bicuspidata var. bicuspidata NRRL YB-4993 TaxID=869754 RepID=A0A1A0HIV1_9ASCO|nr:hypothetical protein METBIDRAFT_10135 [Metschnikowia bicuspidata var. bicuspidata NRRL YB-4993]OBA23931.1 hypothetical protein METBIDRAFT_10135 [Metschnikowia bicuspidata var. bicuspidata NRRL YB-4993]
MINETVHDGILGSEKARLEEQNKTLFSLLDLIVSIKNKHTDDLIVHIGCGFWTRKAPSAAIEFIMRQIKGNIDMLEKLSAQISKQSEHFGSIEVNQDYLQNDETTLTLVLPIVEIQEDLDEDGNIISTKLNNEPFSMNLSSDGVSEKTSSDVSQVEFQHILDITLKPCNVTKDVEEKRANSDEQLDELFNDMGIIVQGTDSGDITEEHENILAQIGTKATLDPTNIYELELIAGKFQTEEILLEDDHEFDYDFESEDELFEIESHSNFTSDIDTLMLPGNSDARTRLRDEIIAHRRQRQEEAEKITSNETRRVRFHDTLQIKEIEDVSQHLRNIEHKKQGLLRFKEAKLLLGEHLSSIDILEQKYDSSTLTSTDHHTVSQLESILQHSKEDEVMSDVSERTSFHSNENSTPKLNCEARVSKFRKSIASRETSQAASLNTHTQKLNKTSSSLSFDDNPKRVSNLPVVDSDIKKKNTFIDVQHSTSNTIEDEISRDQMNKLVQAYHHGEFDDDLNLTGPVVNKLDDFSLLNKIIESMNEKSPEVSHVSGFIETEIEPDAADELESSSPYSSDEDIITDCIIEREEEDFKEGDTYHTDQVQQDVIDREIAEQYHRLKKKLFTTDKHTPQEFEYDDEGTMSKFKSRQLRMD